MKKCVVCKGLGTLTINTVREVCSECRGTGGEKPITAAPHGSGIGSGVVDRGSMAGVTSGCFRRVPLMYSDS